MSMDKSVSTPNRIRRSYSDKYVSGMSDYDLFKNKNVDWISGPFTKVCYLLFLLLGWGTLHISTFFSAEDCWTVTNIAHGVVCMNHDSSAYVYIYAIFCSFCVCIILCFRIRRMSLNI